MLVCGFSANQHGFAALDYDDGTEFMNSTSNVLVYSGFKACWHSNNQRYSNNLLSLLRDWHIDGPFPALGLDNLVDNLDLGQRNAGVDTIEVSLLVFAFQDLALPDVAACEASAVATLRSSVIRSTSFFLQFLNFDNQKTVQRF